MSSFDDRVHRAVLRSHGPHARSPIELASETSVPRPYTIQREDNVWALRVLFYAAFIGAALFTAALYAGCSVSTGYQPACEPANAYLALYLAWSLILLLLTWIAVRLGCCE